MTDPVYILGGTHTDFARNWNREGSGIDAMMDEVLDRGLAVTDIVPRDIGSVHVGNFVAELFCHQGQLGGIVASLHPDLSGVPTMRHEAACASGSVAILAAAADIEAGRYDLSCVLGVESMRNVSGERAADYLAAAAWRGREWTEARYVWPAAFSELIDAYSERYGRVDYAHLGEIARKNFENARRNPLAQARDWTFHDRSFTEDDEANPVVEGRVRKNDCGRVTDGAAVLFLASRARAEDYVRARGRTLADLATIEGWGHRTAPMLFSDKLVESRQSRFVLPQVHQTIRESFERTGIDSPFELDAIETHDCFAMTEYAAIDCFGITEPGESWRAIEEGVIALDGRLPINPSGGLIGLGHPVGATGVRMMVDGWRQVTGRAGAYQVEGAQRVGLLNIGGSTTTITSFVVGACR